MSVKEFFDDIHEALTTPWNLAAVDAIAEELVRLRRRCGRLFCVGVGGGLAMSSHAVCDFRKLCAIEAYAPGDAVVELTARANDEGWDTIFVEWLKGARLGPGDLLMVFSVGGGTADVSPCITQAVCYAQAYDVGVVGVVGQDGGIVKAVGQAVVSIVPGSPEWLTPVTEAAQAAVLHALVSDPRLQVSRTKW